MNRDIQVKDGNLFFGDKHVSGLFIKQGDEIPKLYVIRVWNGSYWGFVTGLDIIDDNIWLGCISLKFGAYGEYYLPSAYYDEWRSIERVLNTVCRDTCGKKWAIFEEEKFEEYPLNLFED